MIPFRRVTLPAQNIRSLCWVDEALVDWVGGGASYFLDSKVKQPSIFYPYRFDAALISPSKEYTVLFERFGTKGVIVQNNDRVVREINRSYYYAHAYEYPINILRLPTGQEVLVHCPNEYNCIEIEDLATGQRLTRDAKRDPSDIFHSRFTTNTIGSYLVSAGWVWHPWSVFCLYNVQTVLQEPQELDGFGEAPRTAAEVAGVLFRDDTTLLLITSDDSNDEQEADEDDLFWQAGPRSIIEYNITSKSIISMTQSNDKIGRFYSLTDQYILNFYEYPKIVDIRTGKTVAQWSDIPCGKVQGSIGWQGKEHIPVAVDSINGRFAVAGENEITVIEIEISTLEMMLP